VGPRSAGQLRFSDTALLQLRFRENGDPLDLTRYSGIRLRHRGRELFKIHLLQPTIVDWDGQRLARWALGDVYRVEGVYSGPLVESATVEGPRMRLRFRHGGSGPATLDGKPLRGFAIAGLEGKFVWADSRIDGDSVVVESREVPAPVAVRYAWAGNPDGNLGNREGLPASPFRTDEWPGLTNDPR